MTQISSIISIHRRPKDGQDGTSPYLLDIDNEMDSVACNKNGNPVATTVITTHARLYNGTTLVKNASLPSDSSLAIDGVTPSVEYSNGVLTIQWTFATTATVSEKSAVTITMGGYSRIFTLNGVRAGQDGDDGNDAVIYSLVPSNDVIKQDKAGLKSPASLTVKFNKIVGTTTTTTTVSPSTTPYVFYSIDNATTWTRLTSIIDITTIATVTKNIRLRLQSSSSQTSETPSGKIYDIETIPLVSDGDKGDQGDKGDPGTGITIKGSALKYYATPALYEAATKVSGKYLVSGKTTVLNNRPLTDSNAYVYTYNATDGTSSIVNANVGDTYVCADNGHLYVVEEYSVLNLTKWIDCGLVKGEQGERGYEGISVRRSEWQEGVYYRNDSADGSADTDGNRYLDEVCITDLATGTADWYVAKAAHNDTLSAAANKPTGSGNDYWQKMNNLAPIRTPYADIQTAFIQYLNLTQLLLKQPDGTVYGAFGAATASNPWPLWFGGTSPGNAITKYNADGSASLAGGNLTYDKDGNVTGTGCTFNTVTGTGCSFSNGTFDGILKASLMYANVKVITVNTYTIDPVNDPHVSFFIKNQSSTYGTNGLNSIHLPSAVTYDGIELQFYAEKPTGTNWSNNMRLVALDGQTINYTESVTYITNNSKIVYVKMLGGNAQSQQSVQYFPMELIVLKAMNGNWYVVAGDIFPNIL